MKVGDIVAMSHRVTRRGSLHEEQVGLVLELIEGGPGRSDRAVVNFAGTILTYPVTYLRIIDEE
jgi:hypothetical protein